MQKFKDNTIKFLIVPTVLGLLFLNFIMSDSDDDSQLLQLERSVISLEAMAQLDQQRHSSKQNIVKIVSRFNKRMPASVKDLIAAEIVEMSVKYRNLDVALICATITHESARTWNPQAVSPVGALGLMQIMPRTGEWLAKYQGIAWTSSHEILFDPIHNIRLGSRYLSALIDTYDLEGGLAAYNGGGKRAKLWLANDKADGILWAETRSYIPNVLKLYDEFKSRSL